MADSLTLDSLVWPLSKAAFAKGYWSRRHFIRDGDPQRFSALMQALAWRGPEEFLRRVGGKVFVWHENMWKYDRPLEVDAEEGIRLCDAGLTVYKVDLQEQIPALAGYLGRLTHQLGLAPHRGGCDLFFTRRGGVVPFHFDASHNFTLQLEGSKSWQVAPNDAVRAPTRNYVVTHPLPPELRSYAPDSLPDPSVWSRAESHQLEPGSLLYLPPSCWHATRCTGYSLSFSFRLGAPRWLDLALEALRIRLLADEEWRDFAYGAFGDHQQRTRARKHLERLMSGLGAHVRALHAEDLIPANHGKVSMSRMTRFRRNLLGTWWIKQRPTPPRSEVVAAFGVAGGVEVDLLLPPRLLQACRWIASRSGPISTASLGRRFQDLPEKTLARLLETLTAAQFLTVVRPR